MNLKDVLDEVIFEGVIEGNGTVFAIGFIILFMFGGMLHPILEALIAML